MPAGYPGAQQAKVNPVLAEDAQIRSVSGLPPPLGRSGSGPAPPPRSPLLLPLAGPARPAPWSARFSTTVSASARGRGLRGRGRRPRGAGRGSEPRPNPLFLPGWGRGCHIPLADPSCKNRFSAPTPGLHTPGSLATLRGPHLPSAAPPPPLPRGLQVSTVVSGSVFQPMTAKSRVETRCIWSCLQGP